MANLDEGHHEEPGALIPSDWDSWRPILQASNQVVLYNPTSHALSVDWSAQVHAPTRHSCPYCKQTLPQDFCERENDEEDRESWDGDPAHQARAANYFHLLELSNETSSRPASPPHIQDVGGGSSSRANGRSAFPAEAMAEGYFKAFFQEEYKLGMGANGSVFLCQHVLDGTPLGHFAVKKIAVGESHSYLLKILREVRLLEQMRHPNIITYHHAWLESCQFSQFGPKVPTLHILMQWAEGGSLDDFIDVRLGRPTKHIHVNPLARSSARGPSPSSEPGSPTSVISPLPALATPQDEHQDDDDINQPDIHSRSARIRAFRAFQKASPEERERVRREMQGGVGVRRGGSSWKAVHLLSAEEVKSLFSDVVEGLAFLHEKSILHLDLKPGNVLLTWDEGKLIPRAMLSDFGTSRDMMSSARVRSGNTGTLEYSSPESLPSLETGLLRQIDSKADMWSLGMILYKMLFFRLPYRYAAESDANGEPVSTNDETEKLGKLEAEVLSYPGFKSVPAMAAAFEARRLPRSFLILLESLLNVVPPSRPSVERVSAALREGKFNPQDTHRRPFMMPVIRRQSTSTPDLAGNEAPEVSPDLHNTTGRDMQMPSPVNNGHVEGEEVKNPQVFTTEMTYERVKLLGPPEGIHTDRVGPAPKVWRVWFRRWARALRARVWARARENVTREVYVRMAKSCILVVKVFTISHSCIQNNGKETNHTWVASLLGLALFDTASDEMWLSAVLVLTHIVLLRIACGGFY